MFRKCLLTLLTAVVLTFVSMTNAPKIYQHHQQTKQEFLNNQYIPAVGILYEANPKSKSPDKPETRAICSSTAFAKTADGFLFVSAAHCVDENPDGKYLIGDDQPDGKRYAATIVAYGDEKARLDFSVLKITAPPDAFTLIPLGHNPVQVGEHIFAVTSPFGFGRVYTEGVVSQLDIPNPTVIDDGVDWQHNIATEMTGEGPGSSGGSIVCEDQMRICAFVIGHVGTVQVSEPVERFQFWFKAVQDKNLPAKPVTAKPDEEL